MNIRVLCFEGCPNREPTASLVRRIARAHDVGDAVDVVEVRSPEQAAAYSFLGSPTVQIDGADIDPSARDRTDFGMACRLYGGSGVPPAGMIARAIQEACP